MDVFNTLSPVPDDISSNMQEGVAPALTSFSVIDPIWIAILKLYTSKDRTMARNALMQNFVEEMPTSSIDRYLQFMLQMNLVETSKDSDFDDGHCLTLTPRGARLVEGGLRSHG
jgi:hypothetical protein